MSSCAAWCGVKKARKAFGIPSFMNTSGTRVEPNIDYLPAGTVLRPLRDQIVVKPMNWTPSKIIQIAGDKRKPLRGEIVFVGPGQRVKKYWKDQNGQRHKVGETGQVIPIEVKPGDIVELGGLELDGYGFSRIMIGNELHIICQEQDVCFITENSEVQSD